MPLYDTESFDKSLIPTAFKADAKELIEVAVMVGWKMHLTTSNGVTIIAPGDPSPKKYHFGMNGRSSISHNRIRRDIVKFGDPEKVMAAFALRDLPVGSTEAQIVAQSLPLPGDPNSVVDDRPKPEPPKVKPERSVTEPKEASIVSEKPMLSSAGKGRAYDSPTTIERKWSDGSRDYKCMSCDYTSHDRGSVPAHHGKAHPKTVKPPVFEGDVPDARVYAPRQSRVEALAQALADAMAAGAVDPESIAREALVWVHEQSRKGTALADEREPMSAEEALERIRALVDTPGERLETQQRLARLEQQMAEANAQAQRYRDMVDEVQADAVETIQSLNERLEQAEAYAIEQAEAAARAQGTLDALRELVAEATVEQAERKAG